MTQGTITASAIVLARNDADRRFPHAEERFALEELRSEVTGLLKSGVWESPWRVYDLEDTSPVELAYLVERGLMTPRFAQGAGEGRGFAVYGEGLASLEINGEDHLRFVGFRAGDALEGLWSLVNLLDDRVETTISYAFDPGWGYLSASPARAGTGLRVYATLHLPALMLTGKLASIGLELVNHGLSLAPLWGGAGGVVQVSNSARQQGPESELLRLVSDVCSEVVEKERSVRKMLLRENPLQARDQIGRSLGLAQHAWTTSFAEAVNLISAAQVGLEAGWVEAPGLASQSAFALMTKLQPAHIVIDHMDRKVTCLENTEIDEIRARIMREVFAGACVR